MADRGISFPFRIIGGRVAESSYDETSIAKIKESVLQIIRTGINERIEKNIGSVTDRLVFSVDQSLRNYLADRLKKDVEEQETRISDVVVTLVDFDGKVEITLDYTIDNKSVQQGFPVWR